MLARLRRARQSDCISPLRDIRPEDDRAFLSAEPRCPFSIRPGEDSGCALSSENKPRRPRSEELEEIAAFEARANQRDQEHRSCIPPAVNPAFSLGEILAEMEADEEAAFQTRERAETPDEQEESHRILGVEAQIEMEVPRLRARELQRTFMRSSHRYAAAACAE